MCYKVLALFQTASMMLVKAHIVERQFAKNPFSKTESSRIIEALFDLIKQSLEKREDFLISGFGKFCVRENMNHEQ
jgi:integration host factor subunit alpha